MPRHTLDLTLNLFKAILKGIEIPSLAKGAHLMSSVNINDCIAIRNVIVFFYICFVEDVLPIQMLVHFKCCANLCSLGSKDSMKCRACEK